MKIFQAHGKLLISSEYMVLFGSKALAVPLQQGQSLHKIRSENRGVFSWNAWYGDQRWFDATFDTSNLNILDSSDDKTAEYLRQLLLASIEIDPSFQRELIEWDVDTHLEFSPDWGFGSSSTLTALLAKWSEINPLDLHFMISEGSGYDVACAIADGPITYRLRDQGPHYQHVDFIPSFSDHLYFAWLGSKLHTASHLAGMAEKINSDYQTIRWFSSLTEAMIEAPDLITFQDLMEEHEERLASILGLERVSTTRFTGLPGKVKSLGAWGGDFVLIASSTDAKELYEYLYKRDISVVFGFNDLVYHGKNNQ